MIKGIQKIKGLGVYGDYARPAGTQDFAVKNLIYGWNYSGKTTLSRLFALLESKQTNSDFSGCTFTLDTDEGPITQANFTQSSLTVRVFNSDFIAKNLNFAGEAFEPILLLGADTDKAQKRLDQCEAMATRAHQRSGEIGKSISTLNKRLSDTKTSEAARIKKNLGLVAAYTASHLQTDITIVELLEVSQALPDEAYASDLKLALTSDQDKPSTIDAISIALDLAGLHNEAKTVLAKTPSLASTLDHLVKNPLIERWVETGLPLHTEKASCEFCGGLLSEHRFTELKAHFSKDLADHKQQIDQLLAKVERAKIEFTPPKDAELNAPFRERFSTAKAEAKAPIEAYNKAVSVLVDELLKKIGAPFIAMEPQPIHGNLTQPILDALKAINDVLGDNNKIAADFVAAKRAAIERLKKHYVQVFLDTFDIRAHNKELARLERHKERLGRCNSVIQTEILRLKAIISQAQLGREDINLRIESLLGSQSVQIKVINVGGQERFQLLRYGGEIAKHLSEGEKTAIAFAFFLSKLKELNADQFKKTVVYIDDPISSLDSNHIFQVTAMIKEVFFHQEKEGGPWSTRCAQTFFSTHNFEFFALLRELNPAKKEQARHFLVRRVGPEKSDLCNMPNSMFQYSSEYHFLFDVLHQFKSAPDKTDFNVLMLLPNAVRRFVELYTFAKYPGARGLTVDQRADRIFGSEKSKRILKVLHYFSHANNIERLAQNSELIFDIEAAVTELIETIKADDPMHMEALEAAVASAQ
ncbi:AAA family ATPase [Stutzerimonas stutzeri]|uniref:Protein CR006 P-loop domain-containing protein n=1 Tax=Stutzerimonas stutzeri TaxID=316 RepID=A0A2N8RDP9_STUST|nr:AAA family ATPase [Stutzerimonas stutzeri]MCQ4254564.1 AAA family ATPase [Stutzerimonas stutzeri]PNF59206.1 hypothetical protein CXK99_13160 [Stutzerimonas stutzeri]